MSKQEFIDKVQSKWISRKLFVFLIGSVALFTGKLQGQDWVIVSSIYISLEGVTSIAERMIKARQGGSQINQTLE
jgi:hypothetical protein